MITRGARTGIVLAVVLASAWSLYLSTMSVETFGFYHDDGIYVVTAKALATGRGYRVISLPWEPTETKYPPLYPFLLSIVWRLKPGFPGNLAWMMSLSALASAASLALMWVYFTRRGYASNWQSLLIVALAAFNWRTALLSSGIYSEPIYTALSIGALFLAEDYEERKGARAKGVVLGLLLGAGFLVRASGLALVAAVGFYFLARKRSRKAIIPVGLAGMAVMVWVAWSYIHRSNVDVVNGPYYTSYLADFRHIVASAREVGHHSTLRIVLELVGRNAITLLLMSGVVLGLPRGWADHLTGPLGIVALLFVLVTPLLMMLGFWKTRGRADRASLIQIYVVLYLLMHLTWPYTSDRFLMPLLPFLLLFLIRELARLFGLIRAELTRAKLWPQRVAAGFVGLVLVVVGGGMGSLWLAGTGGWITSKKIRDARSAEDLEAIDWIKQHTDAADVIVSYRDPTYYLYTGRRATRSSTYNVAAMAPGYDSDIDGLEGQVLRIVQENQARYLVMTSTDFALEYQPNDYREAYTRLLDHNPTVFAPVFKSESGAIVYRIDCSPPRGQ